MTIGSSLILSDVGNNSIEFKARKHVNNTNQHLLIDIFTSNVKQQFVFIFIVNLKSIEETYDSFLYFCGRKKRLTIDNSYEERLQKGYVDVEV